MSSRRRLCTATKRRNGVPKVGIRSEYIILALDASRALLMQCETPIPTPTQYSTVHLEPDQSRQRDRVAHPLQRLYRRAEDQAGPEDEDEVFDDFGEGEDEGGELDEVDGGEVEREGRGAANEDEDGQRKGIGEGRRGGARVGQDGEEAELRDGIDRSPSFHG